MCGLIGAASDMSTMQGLSPQLEISIMAAPLDGGTKKTVAAFDAVPLDVR